MRATPPCIYATKMLLFWKSILEIRGFFLAHFLLNNVTSRNYDN